MRSPRHGDFNVRTAYVDPGGIRLGAGLNNLYRSRKGKDTVKLTDEQIGRMESIGMDWGGRNSRSEGLFLQ